MTAGVQLSQMGSLKDRILVKFQMREDMRSLSLHRIDYINTLATAKLAGLSKENIDLIQDSWRVYTETTLGLEANITIKAQADKDAEMLREYNELYRHMRPKIELSEDQTYLKVTGLT